jgi:hypothetical protein
MSAFGVSDLERLRRILDDVHAETRLRRPGLSRELLARRLFDAAREGLKDEADLKAAVLSPDNDDDPFPPDIGMRPLPMSKPIWPVPGLAA